IEMRQEPGSTVRVRIMRPGSREPFEVDVTVGAASGAGHEPEDLSWRGMRLEPLCDAMRREFGTHYREGVVVVDIAASGNAYRAGLRRGDVIVEINNVMVKTLGDFRTAVAKIPAANVVRVRTTTGIGHIQGETRAE
ncbi:MAG: PDZ domain-containing protein, partial [Planctomycetes bacterium]|nr:PDZ domain-containing protein [Planctomycetota bacterium]